MIRAALATLILCFAAAPALAKPGQAAPGGILDPHAYVADVYAELEADGWPPSHEDDIYSPRIRALIDRAEFIDFNFWVNGQDYTITNVATDEETTGEDARRVTASFENFGEPQRMVFTFVRTDGAWLIDEIESREGAGWTLSEMLTHY